MKKANLNKGDMKVLKEQIREDGDSDVGHIVGVVKGKKKDIAKRMKNPNSKKYTVARVKNRFSKESIVLKNKKTGAHGIYFP